MKQVSEGTQLPHREREKKTKKKHQTKPKTCWQDLVNNSAGSYPCKLITSSEDSFDIPHTYTHTSTQTEEQDEKKESPPGKARYFNRHYSTTSSDSFPPPAPACVIRCLRSHCHIPFDGGNNQNAVSKHFCLPAPDIPNRLNYGRSVWAVLTCRSVAWMCRPAIRIRLE